MFSSNLQRLRKQKRLTQVEMAKILDVAKTTYASYEQNRRMPDNIIQNKIADFFNVTLDELHGRESVERHSFKDAKALMFEDKEGWDNLSEEEQNRIWEELSNLADYYIEKENRSKGKK